MKRKGLYATIEPFKKRVVKYLTPYYYQNGAWHKTEDLGRNLARAEAREKAKRKRA